VSTPERAAALQRLDAFVGEWTLEITFPGMDPMVGGRVTFEWTVDGPFLVQRWVVEHPDAPNGIAIIGADNSNGRYIQNYSDDRGVERIYDMTLADGTWKLWRDARTAWGQTAQGQTAQGQRGRLSGPATLLQSWLAHPDRISPAAFTT
jgi:hypothetical protein